ncbi:DUF4349 domain-containing protein [soil metagenome]
MKTLWLLTLSIVLLFGCGNAEKEPTMGDASSAPPVEPSREETAIGGSAGDNNYSFEVSKPTDGYTSKINVPDANGTQSNVTATGNAVPAKVPDKIIKTGNMSMEVEEYHKAMQEINDKVKAAQGYISNQNEQRSDYRITNSLSIRVPNQNFDVVVNGIGDVAKKLIFKNVNMQDVSEEYTDVAARLKTKKEVEQRYLDILKSAKTIKDILEVESQLKYIREEIESATARLKFMDDRVSYSTISVEMYQEFVFNAPAPLQAVFGSKLLDSIIMGWNGLLALIIGLVRIWPMMLVVAVVLFILFRKWRRGMVTS